MSPQNPPEVKKRQTSFFVNHLGPLAVDLGDSSVLSYLFWQRLHLQLRYMNNPAETKAEH